MMGIGKAAVYKHIPEYFPDEVGGGGLGGFFCPILFGYLLKGTGLWTTWWMHAVIQRMLRKAAPEFVSHIEEVEHRRER